MNCQECETQALADFAAHVGRYIETPFIAGYTDSGDSADYKLDTPIIVRVQPTNTHDILHWSDAEWIDPYWDVDIVSGTPPVPLRSTWIDGPSYNAKTGKREWHGCRVLSRWEVLKLRLFK